jgi:putative PIG3 family NAD(P)H quinone oxidoreductase
VGNNCGDWKKGDKVFGLIPGGGYAEYAVINSETAMRIPDNLSFIEAAAIPEVFLTAYQTIFWLGELKPHQRILIHAGGSGVGTAAIQLAQEIDAEILVTAGSEEKLNVCRRLGASILINYKEGPFLQRVLDATNGEGVNLILDFIGAPYWEQNIKALSNEGRLILISMLGGATVEGFNLNYFLMKNLEVISTALRSRSVDYKIRLTKEFSNFALPRFQDGRLHPIIDKIFPLNKVADAHQYMEENKNIGKIILSITS